MTDGGATFGSLRGVPDRWRVGRVGVTGSTNADLARLAQEGAPPGSVLVADQQTAGRGRLGRTWEAPPGASLLVSVLLRPPPGAALHGATWAVGLACRDACTEVAGVRPDLKWPNDLMVGGRKLAGILAEAALLAGDVTCLVVGMGLNVTWPAPAELPGELAERVVALNHLGGVPVDRDALLASFLRRLSSYMDTWQDEPAELLTAYRAGLSTLGRQVRVELGEGTFTGTALDVDHDGALVVGVAGGERRVVRAGDVVHLRPA